MNWEKYLQNTYLIKDLNQECIKKSFNVKKVNLNI